MGAWHTGPWDLTVFLDQVRAVKKMGPLEDLLRKIPGIQKAMDNKGVVVDEDELDRMEAIVLSMTPEERRHPLMIGESRRRRIARGSGTTVLDVHRLLKDFDDTAGRMGPHPA